MWDHQLALHEARLAQMPIGPCCSVCGHPNASYHYGSFTCNGCQSFFMRIVRGNLQLECNVGDNECLIDDAVSRRCCRSCRYRKCLAAGMEPRAVQPQRDGFKRRPNTNSCSEPVQSGPDRFQNRLSVPKVKSVDLIVAASTSATPSLDHRILKPFLADVDDESLQRFALRFESEVKQAVELYIKQQNWKQMIRSESGSGFWYDVGFGTDYRVAVPINEDLVFASRRVSSELLRLLAFPLVTVAKQDAHFSALSLRDQIALIRSFSPAVVLLDDAKRSTSYDDCLVLVDGIHVLPRRPSRPSEPIHNIICGELLPVIRKLEPDEVEFALLKCILFWNVDSLDLEARSFVRETRQKFLCALESYVANKTRDGRIGSLLLLLSTVERHSRIFKKQMRCWLEDPNPIVREVFLVDA